MNIGQIFQMALKDIKLIVRDRLGLFFIAIFPIMMGLFFGSMMSGMGGSGGSSKMRVAVVDNDQSAVSKSFVESLSNNEQVIVDATDEVSGKNSVRKGARVAVIILPKGFGEYAGVFWNEAPSIDIGVDPSRQAEAAMLEGFIMQSVGELVGERMANPTEMKSFVDQAQDDLAESDLNLVQRGLMSSFLSSVDSMISSVEELQDDEELEGNNPMANGMQFANVNQIDVSREIDPKSTLALTRKIRSGWDISFPQAMLWGVLSCVAGFAISIARERSMGTLLRLQVSPVSRFEILAGKALACFLTVLAVIALLTLIGVGLGMRPESYPKLVVAALCVSFSFVGIMMVISVIGKTEQGVSGAGWGINMVMAMIGGAMIPAVFLPSWMKQLSLISPVRWGIESLEGAIWRQYSWNEMLVPCGVLLGIGLVATAIGGWLMKLRKF